MPEAPRSQRYEGLFPSQTQEMFDTDARSAAEHDWYPTSQDWTGPVLFVQYQHDPGRRLRSTSSPKLSAPQNPPPAQPPMWDDDGVSIGRSRRVLVGVAVGLVVAAVVATTLVGTQFLNRPATDAQRPGDPVSTPASVYVIQPFSLGSRAVAVDLFRARGFSGVLQQLPDGREQWRGTDKRSSVAEVIGPEERITEVSLAVRNMRGEKRDNKARDADIAFLLAGFAPLAAEWAVVELEATDPATTRTVEQRFGDLVVRLVSMPIQGGTVVKLQIMTE